MTCTVQYYFPCIDKWINLDQPKDIDTKGNLLCPNCYPTCNYYRYDLSTTFSWLKDELPPFKSDYSK